MARTNNNPELMNLLILLEKKINALKDSPEKKVALKEMATAQKFFRDYLLNIRQQVRDNKTNLENNNGIINNGIIIGNIPEFGSLLALIKAFLNAKTKQTVNINTVKKTKTKPGKRTTVKKITVESSIEKILTEKIATMQSELEANIERIRKSIITAIRKSGQETASEIKALMAECLKEMQKEVNSLKDDMLSMFNTIKDILNAISGQIAKANKTLDGLLSEIGKLNSDVDSLKSLCDDNFKSINSKLDDQAKQLERILNILESAARKIDEINAIISILPAGLHQLETAIDDIKKLIQSQSQEMKDLLVEIVASFNKIMSKLDGIEKDNKNLGREIAGICSKLVDIVSILNGLVTPNDLAALDKKLTEMIGKNHQQLLEEIKNMKELISKIPAGGGGGGGGGSNDDRTKKYQHWWCLAKGEKEAKKMKKSEDAPKDPKSFIVLSKNFITGDLNEKKQMMLDDLTIRAIARIIIENKFNLDKAQLCLGARVVGTDKPWRWDIKPLKTNFGDIYTKLNDLTKSVSALQETLKEIEHEIKHDEGENTSLFWVDSQDLIEIIESLKKIDAYMRATPSVNDWRKCILLLLLALNVKEKGRFKGVSDGFSKDDIVEVERLSENNLKAKEILTKAETQVVMNQLKDSIEIEIRRK